MLQLSTALLANMDVRKLLGAFSASLGEIIPHDAATLALDDPQQSTDGELPEHGPAGAAARRYPDSDPENSPAGTAFRTRAPILFERMAEAPFAPESMRHLTNIGMQSGCWVPLIHRGEVSAP